MTTSANDPILISESGIAIDPGPENQVIQFLSGTDADTVVLHAGGVDSLSGFNPGTDILDLRTLFSESNVALNGDFPALSNYLTVSDQGSDARLSFDPTGHSGGSVVAVLQGVEMLAANLGYDDRSRCDPDRVIAPSITFGLTSAGFRIFISGRQVRFRRRDNGNRTSDRTPEAAQHAANPSWVDQRPGRLLPGRRAPVIFRIARAWRGQSRRRPGKRRPGR